MQASEQVQVLAAHPFFAALAGMALQGKLRSRQPAAQRFGINTQATSSLGDRDEGHRALLSCGTYDKNASSSGKFLGGFPGVWCGKFPRRTLRKIAGKSPGKASWLANET